MAKKKAKRVHITKGGTVKIYYAPKKNPGTNWHVGQSELWQKRAETEAVGSADFYEATGRMLAHDTSAQRSIFLGMPNPKKGQRKCPVCSRFSDYQWQSGGWYCPEHKFFFPSDLRNPRRRELSVPEKHQLRIARDTLRMPDAMVRVMGGPTKAEAKEIIKRLTGKYSRTNPITRKRRQSSGLFPILVVGAFIATIVYFGRKE